MKCAVRDQAGNVTNIAEADDLDFIAKVGWFPLDSADVQIGDKWDGTKYTRPPKPPALPPEPTFDDQLAAIRKAILTGDKGDLTAIDARVKAHGKP
jgi:hypothetical protein